MPIFAIFEEHENGYDDNSHHDIENVLIGYVEDEEIAKSICDMSEQIAKHKAEQKAYDAWYDRKREWHEANKHRYIDANRIMDYVTKRERLMDKINSIPKPDLSKIPAERHHIVMGGYYGKTHALNMEIADLTNKIKASIDIEAAQANNLALNAERDTVLGPEPTHPKYVYKKHYELIEKLA